MQLKVDPAVFEEQQLILVRELVQSVRVKLQEAGLSDSKLEDVTASIVFSVASIIDDTSAIEVDGTEVHPYLTFRTADEELTHCGENSYTHEFVYEVLQAMHEK
jgi:orotidine-5'-phosphate decarboxylase